MTFSRLVLGAAMIASLAVCAPIASAQADAQPDSTGMEEETDLYSFYHAYPVEAAQIPALVDLFDYHREELLTGLRMQAGEDRATRPATAPFMPHYLSVVWSREADLPGWLSLSALIESYSGGAHPNHQFSSLLWDKRAGMERAPELLFVSPKAFHAAIAPAFCAELDRQRLERRGEVIPRSETIDSFVDCPATPDLPIVLTGADSGFDGLRILVAPYVAGPYAEGSYEVNLPISASLRAAIAPEHREAFAPAR